LAAPDREFKQRLHSIPTARSILPDAYPYLANRHQLKQAAVVEIPEDQLSPADVQKTVNASQTVQG